MSKKRYNHRDNSMDAFINQLGSRIADLESTLKLIHTDLIERAVEDQNGFKVVAVGSSVWSELKRVLNPTK
jgi:hypothetical protein|tara:strand:+ start:595 stop:807 length:213 start_codon:yes stop_codon:yes gene_type:complete